MQTSWEPEHSQALRDYLAKGLSYAEIARAINATFHTAYSRNAAIGRAKRMGLAGLDPSGECGRPKSPRKPRPLRFHKMRKRIAAKFRLPRPIFASGPRRCNCAVSESCRAISRCWSSRPAIAAIPLAATQEGEAITFCGHPRREGSSYCVSHFHLTRGIGSASERSAVKVLLRLVEAA